ncbi:MAG: NAD(P)/FAD-dependent oxidoreductase [Planctomycetaceae bacterium]|nr:NAD(P)/FAD-dependent oxidoreductase [Planctomycetaceae bacterium]
MATSVSQSDSPRIIIAGAGMSGLCLAIQLKRSGIESFQIFEKSSEVGGTWLDNHYPNSGCDIPSHLYSFSFDRRHDWSQKYARQPEILNYFKTCADKFGIRSFIQFDTSIEEAVFDEAAKIWRVTTSDGKTHEADIFVSAVGQLNRPKIPQLEGLDQFQGATWHSARWNDEFDPTDRDVAVIGNGASAIQFLPGLAGQARSVTLFQRSPNWIHPLHNYRYPGWAKFAFRWIPLAARLHRGWIFLISEGRFIAFANGENFANKEYRRWLTRRMKKAAQPNILPDVIPDYPPGCKRILLSSDYIETLNRENVRLVSRPLEKFTSDGVVVGDETIPVDAAIFATGFETTGFLQPMRIVGRDGVTLDEAFHPRPKTLFGVMAAGFPNFFMLYGPNTNLGHNSIIFMVECQVNYILNCLQARKNRQARAIEPKVEAVEQYDNRLQHKLNATIWAGDCASWYKNAQGSIVNNWWGTATAFWKQTRRLDSTQFLFE